MSILDTVKLSNTAMHQAVFVPRLFFFGAEIKKTDVLKINWQKNNLWVGLLSFWFLSFSKKENVTRTTIYRLLFFCGIVFFGGVEGGGGFQSE